MPKKWEKLAIPSDAVVSAETLGSLFGLTQQQVRLAPIKDAITDSHIGTDAYRLIPAIELMLKHKIGLAEPDQIELALDGEATLAGYKLKTAKLDYEKKLDDQKIRRHEWQKTSDAQIKWAQALGQILQSHEDFLRDMVEELDVSPDQRHELAVKAANFRNRLANENWLQDALGVETETEAQA